MVLGGFDIVVIALVVFVILVLFAGIKTVPQGYRYTIERFGRYTRTLEPGLNLITPFIERVGARMNVMEQVLNRADPGGDHQGQRLRLGRCRLLLPDPQRRRRPPIRSPISKTPS